MTRRWICLLLTGLVAITGLSACEQQEEPVIPPAALEKPAANKAQTPQTPIKQQQGSLEFEVIDERPDPDAAPNVDAESLLDESFPDVPADEKASEDQASSETGGEDEQESGPESDGKEIDSESENEPVAFFSPELLKQGSAHICFFSFNTGVEYVQLKRMITQLNAATSANISVTEYQVYDSDPFDSFEKLVKSGKQCDGVVLSGHHTDEFYGERTSGDLEIEDLEELACEPKYTEWFGNIKALWLQGCNTVKAGVNNEDVDEDDIIRGSPVAYLQRLLNIDDMEESLEDMQELLEENINEENLVNDYMRVFSGATVYGWSNIAPGEQAGARKSIPFHLAQVTRLVDNDKKYFVDPLQAAIPKPAAERYSQVLYGLLNRPNRPDATFPKIMNEGLFMQAWKNHGNFRYKYSFDNPDIEAFPALGNSQNEILKQLKGLNCLIHQLEDDLEDMSVMQVANHILRSQSLTTYNSYLLWAMLRKLKEEGQDKTYNELYTRLRSDPHLVSELRYQASLGGISQQDAKSFLATLNQPEILPARVKVADTKPEPTPEKETEKPPEAKVNPAKQTAKPESEPWYMQDIEEGTASDKEHVFDFSSESNS